MSVCTFTYPQYMRIIKNVNTPAYSKTDIKHLGRNSFERRAAPTTTKKKKRQKNRAKIKT